MTKVVLHVGQPKAGSTALQHAFCTHEALLREHGVLYPMEGATSSRRMDGQVVLSHNLLAGLGVPFENIYAPLRQYYIDEQGLHVALERFKEGLKRELVSNPQTLVLSGEMICEAPAEALAAIRDWLSEFSCISRVEVCLYVRSPVDTYKSRVLQDVKTALGFTSPDAFMVDYRSEFERLAHVFGADAVKLARFEASSAGWDVTEDFSTRFLGFPFRADRMNEALAPEAVFFLDAYWNACKALGPLGRTKYELLVSWLECNPYTASPVNPHHLRPSVVTCIAERHHAQLAWLQSKGIDFVLAGAPKHFDSSAGMATTLADIFESAPSPKDMRAFDMFVTDGLLHACVVMNEALNAGA